MDELHLLHRVNADKITSLVTQVGDRWDTPTSYANWTVRELLNHLTAEQLWAPELLAGRSVEEIGDRFEGDLLGDDPLAAWRLAVESALAAFSEPGALERTVQFADSPLTADQYLDQMVTDLALHSWDLATAIGADADLDPATVDRLLVEWTGRAEESLRGPMFTGPDEPPSPIDVSDEEEAQTRLLALFGRRV